MYLIEQYSPQGFQTNTYLNEWLAESMWKLTARAPTILARFYHPTGALIERYVAADAQDTTGGTQ